MELTTHTKDLLISNGYTAFIEHIELLDEFYRIYFIKDLTIQGPKPKNLIGQNLLIFIQTNLYRVKSFSRGYIESLNQQNPLCSAILVRALFETTGAIAFAHKKYIQFKEQVLTEEEFDSDLSKLYLGTKDKINLPESPDPFNVMKLIDAADHFLKKKYGYTDNKFRKGYDNLSELTHPNSFGYLLGHTISKDLKNIHFTVNNEEFPLNKYELEIFAFTTHIYKEIFMELRELVEQNEELPFAEFKS
ncbi:hypothetical protein [Bacillus cereus]|uniref:hypothetical protein n=1 Tax=Bacillus cereus TaxID=1396 RepID=UPI0018F3D4B4|nr:hypothetical protein [Bacillus cereus]MBJ7987698.1 hypothetical protein [Bacillus cereus]